ncbi:hypothetical protein BN2364_0595 [Alloalcanivorax xenomutans]|nr:hypothetical protein BN2364_0595 [Alloalcanivorax xenomutans]
MRAERNEYAAGAWIHQRHAGHRELAAQGSVLDQHREALGFQCLDTLHQIRILRQYLWRHVRQGQLFLDDLLLHRPLEDLRQTLHLRFGQGIAGAHAVTEKQVLDQIGGEPDRLAIRTALKWQRTNSPLHLAGIGVNQIGAAQFTFGVIDGQAVLIQNAFGQFIIRAGLEPALVRVMHEGAVGDLLTEELIIVEKVAVQPLDEFPQGRAQGALLGGALAVGEAHRRGRVTDVQRPHMGHDIAPRGDLDLHAQRLEDAGHGGDGFLQWPVLALDISARLPLGRAHQQRLGILVQILHRLDLELRPSLYHLLHRTAVDGAQNTLPVLVGDVLRQLHLNTEDLVIAVLRVDDVVLRQADIVRGDIPRLAVHLDEVSRAQCRRCQEVVERARRRAVTLVADRLIRDDGEVVELGFQAKVVEEVDLDFHGESPGWRVWRAGAWLGAIILILQGFVLAGSRVCKTR